MYTTIAKSHNNGLQDRIYLSKLNTSGKIATPPDTKTPNHCVETYIRTCCGAANSGGWVTLMSFAEDFIIHIHVSTWHLRSWVSAYLDWLTFTTFKFQWFTCISIIPPTPSQTSCPCRQHNYFCVFRYIGRSNILFHILSVNLLFIFFFLP